MHLLIMIVSFSVLMYINSIEHPNFGPSDLLSRTKRWLRSGPRKHLFFNPDEVKAGILVVGGLLPGLNVIIRELTMCLYYNYKV